MGNERVSRNYVAEKCRPVTPGKTIRTTRNIIRYAT